jgi:hypothetical protein
MKIIIEIDCEKDKCGGCKKIITSADWLPVQPFCGVFSKVLAITRQADYTRLSECINAGGHNESFNG